MLTGESLTMVVSPGMSSEKCWFPVESAEARAGQGSHSDWKTWKNGKAFSSQGKVREF